MHLGGRHYHKRTVRRQEVDLMRQHSASIFSTSFTAEFAHDRHPPLLMDNKVYLFSWFLDSFFDRRVDLAHGKAIIILATAVQIIN